MFITLNDITGFDGLCIDSWMYVIFEVHNTSKGFLPVICFDWIHSYKIGVMTLKQIENKYLTTNGHYIVHFKMQSTS